MVINLDVEPSKRQRLGPRAVLSRSTDVSGNAEVFSYSTYGALDAGTQPLTGPFVHPSDTRPGGPYVRRLKGQ